jgi:muramoyltetrapeptide carboxypeptidase
MSGLALPPVRWPPPVSPGDRVGVAALSGVVDPEALERGLDALRGLGFEPVVAANCNSTWGELAGTDQERLAGFHELAADPALAAIFFARGGHGLLRLLPAIDWQLLGRPPRAYVGYSDLTPFLLQVVQRLRLIAFHGPMVAKDLARGLGDSEAESLLGALAGEPPASYPLRHWLRRGSAEGVLLGGCLSLLVTLLGTPWLPSLEGAILFLEDVDEPVYSVDRMLTHLRLSGNLAPVRGMVAGHLGEEWRRGEIAPWHQESFLALPGPLAFGLEAGHGVPNLTLPLGATVRIDGASGGLEVDRDMVNLPA